MANSKKTFISTAQISSGALLIIVSSIGIIFDKADFILLIGICAGIVVLITGIILRII